MALKGATEYHVQLDFLDKGRAIKGLVVYRANERFTLQIRREVCFMVREGGLEPEVTPSPLEVIIKNQVSEE